MTSSLHRLTSPNRCGTNPRRASPAVLVVMGFPAVQNPRGSRDQCRSSVPSTGSRSPEREGLAGSTSHFARARRLVGSPGGRGLNAAERWQRRRHLWWSTSRCGIVDGRFRVAAGSLRSRRVTISGCGTLAASPFRVFLQAELLASPGGGWRPRKPAVPRQSSPGWSGARKQRVWIRGLDPATTARASRGPFGGYGDAKPAHRVPLPW